MAIDERYSELELGLVDASVVALAEELDRTRLATRELVVIPQDRPRRKRKLHR